MKALSVFFISVVIGIIAIVSYTLLSPRQVLEKDTSKDTVTQSQAFDLAEAPKETLRAQITSLEGDVKWQSRVATEPAELKEPRKIQQGEEILTEEDATVELSFTDLDLSLSPETHLSIIQTLPQSMVFQQIQGIVEYIKTSTSPLAIRSYHLLIQQNEAGNIIVSVDPETGKVMVDVVLGSITTAYNDLENVSTVETTQAGETFVYDDTTRTSIIR